MTPDLFKAFHRKRGVVPLTSHELHLAGWNITHIKTAISRGYIKAQRVDGHWVYDLLHEPQWSLPLPDAPPVKRTRVAGGEIAYALAWQSLCRQERLTLMERFEHENADH